MPKVSKVGKFRKTAAVSAAAAHSSKRSDDVTKPTKEKHPDSSMDTDDKPRRKVERSKSFTQIMENSTVRAGDVARGSSKTKKEGTTASDTDVTVQDDKETALSRGQKRRQAKRDQYLKREQMVLSSLQLKKEENQKKRIDGLDALKQALLETVRDNKEEETQKQLPPARATTNKAKRSLVASELHNMSLVLQHPEFQKNPFEAMQEHLRNTLLKQGEAQEAEGQVKRKEEAAAKQQRKEDRKERLRDMKGGRKKKQRTKFNATRSRKSR